MQFMVLISDFEKDQAEFGSPEFMDYMKRWMELEEDGKKRGILMKGGGKLDVAAKTKRIRKRDGKTVVTDGPHAETKEVLGGYMIVECDTIDEAIAYAEQIPVLERGFDRGVVEVRPFQQSQYDTKL